VSDLAAWLLEQITEDERPTYGLVPFQCEPGCCAPAGWVGHRCLICGTTEYGGTVEAIDAIAQEHAASIHSRARVLAECEAKRRVVSLCARVVDDDEGHNYYSDGWAGLQVAVTTLRFLALPYSDRPGYRQEEWAP
jgi:hypothetical protein